jgi:hypothetical protein
VVAVQGGVILFRGAGADALRYVESDRSRADDYYLGSDATLAEFAALDSGGNVTAELSLGSVAYAGWVDWTNPVTGESDGQAPSGGAGSEGIAPVRGDGHQHPQVACRSPLRCTRRSPKRLDAAQQDALAEIRRWLAQHSVTRVGPLGAQEVVPSSRYAGGRDHAPHDSGG